jgi:hypothetical protein
MAAAGKYPIEVPADILGENVAESKANGEAMAAEFSDHDLLIKIDTQVEMIRADLHSSVEDRVKLWREKANVTDLNSLGEKMEESRLKYLEAKTGEDHERRLRAIERYVWLAIGGLFIIQLLWGIVVRYGLPH